MNFTQITRYAFLWVTCLGLSCSFLSASVIDDTEASERVGFFVKGLKICHQGEWRNMTVKLEYDSEMGGKAMDIQKVKDHVRYFLETFPNTTDFWEIMNTKLVNSLLKEYPDIVSMKSILALAPDKTLSYPRESIVQYDKDYSALKESFKFIRLKYGVCSESFKAVDLHVSWDMKDNPAQFDYPDYQWVDQAMGAFFEKQPLSFSKWSTLKPELEKLILEKFSTLEAVQIEITVAE